MSIRDQQLTLARNAIVDACAELVTERHHLDFSMKEVAERAGVSLRTIYNHFATREDLLDALGARFDQKGAELGMAASEDLDTIDALLTAVVDNTRAFEELGGISEAIAQMPLADIGRDDARRARTERISSFIASQLDAPEESARAIALVLRHLLSHRSWFWLTREYGLTEDEFTAVVGWLISLTIDAAARGDHPFSEETPS